MNIKEVRGRRKGYKQFYALSEDLAIYVEDKRE